MCILFLCSAGVSSWTDTLHDLKCSYSGFISIGPCCCYQCAKTVNGKSAMVWNNCMSSQFIVINIQNYSCLFHPAILLKDIWNSIFFFVSFFKPFSMVIIMYKCFYYYCWLAFSHFKHCVWPEVSGFFPFFLLLKIVIFTISQQISVMIKECVKYCWACKLFIVHVMTVTWHDVSPFNTLKWSLWRLNTYILLV